MPIKKSNTTKKQGKIKYQKILSIPDIKSKFNSIIDELNDEIKSNGTMNLYIEDYHDLYDLPRVYYVGKYSAYTEYALCELIIDGDNINLRGISIEDDRDEMFFWLHDLNVEQQLHLLEHIYTLKQLETKSEN